MKRSFRRFGIAAAVLALTLSPLAASDPGPVLLNIQLYDQQLYYEGDPVQVRVTLTNESTEPYRFRLADTRLFNLEFEIKDMASISARPSAHYTTVLGENKPIYVREVSIQPGEEFSFIEQLQDYQDLPGGIYTVRAYFHPELLNNKSRQPLYSNRFNLSIRPAARRQRQVEDRIQVQVQDVLSQEKLPPDQVVAHTIAARQKNLKEAFFLYLDLEALYRTEPRRGAIYKRMSEMDRLDQIAEYRELLWTQKNDDAISYLPKEWKITNTNYTDTKATVSTIQKFVFGSLIEVKEYIYQLEKRQDVWYIVNYTVNNKGTE